MRELRDYHSGLSDDGEQRVVDDINRYETLQSRRRAIVREIDKAYDRNDRNTDRDVSNLTIEREGIVRDMDYINQRYRIDEIDELKGTNLQDKPTDDFEVHNIPGVSNDDFNQAVSDFRSPITEDNVDEFMTELSLLQDEGLRLDM